MKPIHVLIAENHPAVRVGVRSLLSIEPDIVIVGEVTSGLELVSTIQALRPDVIVMECSLPIQNFSVTVAEVGRVHPNGRFLVLSKDRSIKKIFGAFQAGALGYLVKDSTPGELLQALHVVYQGEPFVSSFVAEVLIREFTHPLVPARPESLLTKREQEVLAFVVGGLSTEAIAARLMVSEQAVQSHLSNVLNKVHLVRHWSGWR